MSRPHHDDMSPMGDDKRHSLVAQLSAVRLELDRLVGSRMLAPLTDAQQDHYRELCVQEGGLLRALAPCIPDRPTPA